MALNLIDLETVLTEIQPVLTGGWIQKIHQPQELALTLDVHSPGTSVTVYLCADPRLARLHFISKKYPNPPTPPPFCQFLRSHLEGGRIEDIRQEPGDRLVYLTIRKNERVSTLLMALLGNRANALLLNEKHVLLLSLKESRVKIGERYVPPATRSSSSSSSPSPWKEHIIEKPGQEKENFSAQYPVSAKMEAYYDKKEQEDYQHTIYDQQLTYVKKALKAAKGKLRALQEDLTKAERYREYGRYGELLKSSLHELHKGQETASLTDYFDPALPTLTLPLDPAKDPVRNMEEYFRKHHKYLGAQEHLLPRIETQQQKIKKIRGPIHAIRKRHHGSNSFTQVSQKNSTPSGSATLQKQATARARLSHLHISRRHIYLGGQIGEGQRPPDV